jgi:NADH:ubiquinone oxidoreductase subunit C
LAAWFRFEAGDAVSIEHRPRLRTARLHGAERCSDAATVSGLAAATGSEREVWDLFGIVSTAIPIRGVC